MSTDERVTKDVVKTLEDGKEGFTRAADRLADSDQPELAPKFREFAAQRGQFSEELRGMAASYGDHVEDDGTVAATLHRGWMAVKDAVTGSDPKGVLDAAEQGEDHAVAEYRDALKHDDLSTNLREVLERQAAAVKGVHDEVKALRDRAA
jgi:uncharacterized protein (TIGR02284 family)